MHELLCALKMIQDNVKILHRNLVGDKFFGLHEVLGEYYDELGDIADDVIEIAISLGEVEPNIIVASESYPSINTATISEGFSYDEALSYVSKYFNDLIDLFKEAKKGIPDVGKKVTIKGKEGKVISSDPLQGKYKVLIDNEVIEVDKNDSKK